MFWCSARSVTERLPAAFLLPSTAQWPSTRLLALPEAQNVPPENLPYHPRVSSSHPFLASFTKLRVADVPFSRLAVPALESGSRQLRPWLVGYSGY